MLSRLGQSNSWAKILLVAAFLMTSDREPLAQNSVITQTGFKHRPMNMTTLGWRMAAIMDTCVTLTHVVLSELACKQGVCSNGSFCRYGCDGHVERQFQFRRYAYVSALQRFAS